MCRSNLVWLCMKGNAVDSIGTSLETKVNFFFQNEILSYNYDICSTVGATYIIYSLPPHRY